MTGCRCPYRVDCKLTTPCLYLYHCQDVGRVTAVHLPSIPTCAYDIIGDSSCSNLFLSFCACWRDAVAGFQAGGIGALLPAMLDSYGSLLLILVCFRSFGPWVYSAHPQHHKSVSPVPYAPP